MTDLDERFPAFREKNPTDVVLRLKCDACGTFTEVTRAEELTLLAKLDPRYPANSLTIDCKCGQYQHLLKARG